MRDDVALELRSIRQEIEVLRGVMAGLLELVEDKTLSVEHHSPFTSHCKAVLNAFEETRSPESAIETWPYKRAHFYAYKRRCPELRRQWEAIKERRKGRVEQQTHRRRMQ